jgi:uncharacterized protein YgiM (DUF1202 family)
LSIHQVKVTLHQTLKTLAYADNLNTHTGAGSHYRANGSIHTGGIAPTGQNSNSFHNP